MCDKITSNYAQIIEDDGLCILKPQVNLSTIITEKINEIIHDIMTYYDTNILDITIPTLYELKQGANNKPQCDSSNHLNGKWVQTFPRDISGYIALCNYNDNIPFDEKFEVYGGKLEFPQHQFGFNPQIGTLILHPSGPHFIHQHTTMEYGNLFYIQFFLKSEVPYLYNPTNFPGDYTTWFKEIV
jgi:hypothetical protein